MAVFNEPTKWVQTLGQDADVVSIPDTAGETEPSIDKIFPSVFSIPLAQGGRAIPRSVLNGLFKLVGDSVYYMQNGGLWSYNSAFDYAVGRVVLYTDGNLYKCIQSNSSTDPKAPTDSDYWSKISLLSDFTEFGFNTGDIKIHTTSTVPNGWLLCNGAGVSRTTFSNLFAEIGTTYGTGDGSTTFNIPDLRDRYIIGANANALGAYIAEQLPNINGQITSNVLGALFNITSNTGTGAFTLSSFDKARSNYDTASMNRCETLSFSANSSNSVYTNSGHVYPQSLALNFIIKT